MRAFLLVPLLSIPLLTLVTEIGPKPRPPSASGSPMGISPPWKKNTFIGSFRLEALMYENGPEKPSSSMGMRYWSTSDRISWEVTSTAADGAPLRMISDLKAGLNYFLMTNSKGEKIAMKSARSEIDAKSISSDSHVEVTVAQETRTILGHLCTKIITTEEGRTWTGWVAKDLGSPFQDMAVGVGAKGIGPVVREHPELKGFALSYEWVDPKAGTRTVCDVHDLELGAVDPAIFSLDGYEVMELGASRR